MNFKTRYSIVNNYIGGSNILPQTLHGLNEMWSKFISKKFDDEANKLWLDWANNSKVEAVLNGMDHSALESFYETFSSYLWLPMAKFNESLESMNGCCTIVSFVLPEKLVAAGCYARASGLTKFNIEKELQDATIPYTEDGINKIGSLTKEEALLVSKIAFLPVLRF